MKAKSWALGGQGPHFPEPAAPPAYDSEKNMLTVPVKLKPNWGYEFTINPAGAAEIQSEKGVPLPSTRVTFKTGDPRGWEPDEPKKTGPENAEK